MQNSEARTKTNLPIKRLTNTPRQNLISTHSEICKCEEEERDLDYRQIM